MNDDTKKNKAGLSFPERWPEDIDVSFLILETRSFVVWLDQDLDVDWFTSDEYDNDGPVDLQEHNTILNRATTIECVPNDHHKISIRRNFKRMVGEGVARSLKYDYSGANRILDEADLYIGQRNRELARFWQLSSGASLALLLAIIGIIIWICREPVTTRIGKTALFLVLSGFAGSLGAFLSMVFRMGTTMPTSEAPCRLHILEAFSRILAGLISGVVLAAAVKLGLLFPTASNTLDLELTMVVVGFAAGISEKWVPSIVEKLQNSTLKADNTKEDAK